MDMITELGPSLDKQLVAINSRNFPVYKDAIVQLLKGQPRSYNIISINGVIEFLQRDLWQAWIATDEMGFGKALVITSVNDLGQGLKGFNIEYLTCKDFHWMAQIYPKFEQIARSLGCITMGAVAHPIIADYACKKHNYHAPGVYISKTLTDEKRVN